MGLVGCASCCKHRQILSTGNFLHLLDSASSPYLTLVLYGKGEILADQIVAVALLPGSETPRPGVDFISTMHVWPTVVLHLGKESWK